MGADQQERSGLGSLGTRRGGVSFEVGNLTRSTLTWDWSELADDGEER